ncbi:hypothetical protein OOK36_48040 [Streptomyces sp. NBC_00365]|uniref:DUF6193 family natural product biosynthesis protein n=1 Tax=Streptomyces sp. NBC_00365 TaxID=2975726 RepID=UPI002254AAA9|nr:hypothetical protein [Streptomyces sp. NBC_00365]MCX5096371.1 hypothetical protein [Streptomyces sp. NBC_00365]
MNSATGRSHDEAWVELLDSHRPPHSEGDWASPSMWLLLQAAVADPLLSSLYPWKGMNTLSVCTSDAWRDFGTEGFPGVAAGSGVYSVIAHPVAEGRVVLETDDPAVAVEVMAREVQSRLVRRTM